MTPLSIGRATELYGNVSQCEITRHWVDHPLLADVSRSLRVLVKSLGNEAEDEYWRQTLGPIRRIAFALCSVPLPFNQIVVSTGIQFEKVHRQIRLCQQLFPDAYVPLTELARKVERLTQESSSPLIAPLEEIRRQCRSLSVMIRNPRMNQVTATFFASSWRLRYTKIVSPTQLRGPYSCDALATIGPCDWFPEYIFAAPRAKAIHVVSFRWIRDDWKPGPVFLHGQGGANGTNNHHLIGALPRLNGHVSQPPQASSDLQPSDLLPPFPALSPESFSGGASLPSSTSETIAAKLCRLNGNRAVLIAADDGATSLIIDGAATGHSAVRRASTNELEPGYYLLVRTSGGGDFIAPLADRIMGDIADMRRQQQSEWKAQLVKVASQRFGSVNRRELAARVASELRLQGRPEIRPSNVFYWMSAKCISPRKAEDFMAVMAFAGLHERAEELWAAMDEIDRAHKRAGFRIRRMLLQKISGASLEPLERDGEMVFDLGDQAGGTLSAFQIVGIQDVGFEVDAGRIGVLLDMEE